MKHFLVTYDRAAGKLLTFREFEDFERNDALQESFRLERTHRDNPDVEVVLLGAESRRALEKTHSRYFKALDELAKAI